MNSFRFLYYFLLPAFSFLLLAFGSTNAYYFWLKSSDDSIENILNIESKLWVHLPVVSFIFDPRDHHNVPAKMDAMAQQLGHDRIYHITISPNMFSAQEVADGKFDDEYLQFFRKIKEKQIKVIFRTMHEMNGWRYPRSSNPGTFKKAWIHVWQLSRAVGLDQNDILFDFSVNHRDMPTKWKPSQTATLYQCKPEKILTEKEKKAEQQRRAQMTEAEKKAEEEKKKKERTDCPKFEDYYPGDHYVDVVGFTFYNRGKANSNRLWLSPEAILLDKEWRTYERLKALGKPLIIDEVGTTAVWYEGPYHFDTSRNEYLTSTARKEQRLSELLAFIQKRPEILAAIYFNVDYTYGLSFNLIGEADRAIVDVRTNTIYEGFYALYQQGEHFLKKIASYFMNAKVIPRNGQEIVVSSFIAKEIWMIDALINKKASTPVERVLLLDKLVALRIKDQKIQTSLSLLQQLHASNY